MVPCIALSFSPRSYFYFVEKKKENIRKKGTRTSVQPACSRLRTGQSRNHSLSPLFFKGPSDPFRSSQGHPCVRPDCSSYSSTRTTHHNRLNAEANVWLQLTAIKPDRENCSFTLLTEVFLFLKIEFLFIKNVWFMLASTGCYYLNELVNMLIISQF